MKLVKTLLLATTLALTAFSTFAAKEKTHEDTDKVVVSTQESAPSDETQTPQQPSTPPATEAPASAPATP